MHVTLKKIAPMKLAVMMCCLNSVTGLLVGIMTALMSVISPAEDTPGGMGAWSIIVFPVLAALFSFLGGLFSAWAYNLFAGWLGGISLDFDDSEIKSMP